MDKLKAGYLANTSRNIRLYHDLKKILAAFHEAGKRGTFSHGGAVEGAPFVAPTLVLLFGRKGIGTKSGMLIGKFFPSREAIAALYPVSRRSLRLPYFYLIWMATLVRRNTDPARRLFKELGKLVHPEPGPGADLAPLVSWPLRAEIRPSF
jgi:hypothetical protein